MQARCLATGLPLVYAHMVGAQDEVVFEGRSFALQADGELAGLAPGFVEQAFEVNCFFQAGRLQLSAPVAAGADDLADVWQALVLGVRDYIVKNRFPGVLLGLSGGIDSALTLALAVDALGSDQVEVILMPSRYTADMSNEDARLEVEALDCQMHTIPIEPAFRTFLEMLEIGRAHV